MLTPPLGVYKISYQPFGGNSLAPVPQREWSRFCNEGDAAALAAELNALTALGLKINPSPYVDPEESSGYIIANPSQYVRMWSIYGVMSDNTPIYVAPAGSFLDRRTFPDYFLDGDGQGGPVGGPNICMRNFGTKAAPMWSLIWSRQAAGTIIQAQI